MNKQRHHFRLWNKWQWQELLDHFCLCPDSYYNNVHFKKNVKISVFLIVSKIEDEKKIWHDMSLILRKLKKKKIGKVIANQPAK